MPRILVLYGTTDGQTAKISRAVADVLSQQGAQVDVAEAGHATVRPQDYAGVIVAASVHAGGYQRAVRRWVRRHAEALRARPTAFVSVCLGVLQKDPGVQRELAAIVRRFLTATGWQPTMTETIPGALLYTRYNWIKRQIMKRIAAKAGGDTDTTRDYEYTNWSDVRSFADRFARVVSGATA